MQEALSQPADRIESSVRHRGPVAICHGAKYGSFSVHYLFGHGEAMARSEITALRGKVLMGVSYGCLWDGQVPEVGVACYGIWLKLAHEKLYLENMGMEIRLRDSPLPFDKLGTYWVVRDRFELWGPLRGVRVVSAVREGNSAIEIVFGDDTVILIRADSTDNTSVADWPRGVPILVVSKKQREPTDPLAAPDG